LSARSVSELEILSARSFLV